jgi:uncharacterized protein (DUF1778 family)
MVQHINRTEKAASERLADRTVFPLDEKKWAAFITALDAPPRRYARLERLFREPSVFANMADLRNGLTGKAE